MAKAIAIAVSSESCPPIVNIVGDQPISILDLAKLLIDISGKKVKIIHMEPDRAETNLIFDSSLLKRTLLPHQKNLLIGLQEEYEYMKRRNETFFDLDGTLIDSRLSVYSFSTPCARIKFIF